MLKTLSHRRPREQTIVGFAAETATGDELLRLGQEKLARKGCDLLVINDVSGGGVFGQADNAITIVSPDAVIGSWTGSKRPGPSHPGRSRGGSWFRGLGCGDTHPPFAILAIRVCAGKVVRMSKRLFSSESVTEGHPDKIADQISDSILDELLRQDPSSRVAVETMLTTGLVMVTGEVTTEAYADINQIVRDTVIRIGYDSSHKGFDGYSCGGVQVSLNGQSADIAQGVDTAWEKRLEASADSYDLQGAGGDQGLMFGYACTETPSLMPLPIDLAHRLAERLTEARKSGDMPYLRPPDGKTQVTVEYEDNKPVRLDTVVVSCQHAPPTSIWTICSGRT